MLRDHLTEGTRLEQTADHIHVQFESPHWVVSSAVLNGGFVEASHILNLGVSGRLTAGETLRQSPGATLAAYCSDCGWSGNTVGMMTSASMNSFRMGRAVEQGVEILVLVTAGLSNVRRAGDPAEYRRMAAATGPTGTINMICLTSAGLTRAAMIEAVITATEAKAAALQNLGIRSPVSKGLATGTGTDAIAIAAGHGPPEIEYCGKHVIFGQILASLVIEAITSSLTRGRGSGADR